VTEPERVLRKRILVVDDDPDTRNLLRLLLSIDQHSVVEAGNGREACLAYTPGEFDLILTDYEMPEMKGDELARTIKCLSPSQRIIMITGVPWKAGGDDNPVDAVLIKPVTLGEIRQFISAVLSCDYNADGPSRGRTRNRIGLGLM